VAKAVATAVPAAAPAAPPAEALQYVVRSGDYLMGIAPALGVKLSELLAANQLSLTSVIYPGMRLTVPAGGRLPVAAAAPLAAPAGSASVVTSADGSVNSVLAFAQAQLGKPYKFNAAGPDSWDCSGLSMAAYAEIGISLPHYSGAQAAFGTAVDWTTQAVQAGDLIFLESSVGSGVINHVGIAISATQWIQAPRSGDVVRVGSIPSTRVISVRRLIGA
jgi:cell wall-associated NlpC family hydrolase